MATLGNNFNLEERQRLLDQSIANANEVDTDGTLRITVTANREEGSNKNPFLQNLENIDRNTFDDNITNGLNLGPYSQVESGIKYFEEAGLVGGKEEKKKDVTKLRSNRTNPLRKIAGGRVLQYPIDLDTDIQDYFEIQVFNYRPAGSLPSVKYSNQGSNSGNFAGGYYSGSNLRGNRQNFRLQDLQSTIQLPVPPSLKDMNAVDFGGQSMSGFAAQIFGPVVASFLGRGGDPDAAASIGNAEGINRIRLQAQNILSGGFKTVKDVLGSGFNALQSKEFRRFQGLNAIAQAVAALGVNIDVNQAITRVSGAVRNPNLELLFKGPALRSFSFTIRLTPRSPEESKRVRMIIRVLKQHSAVKSNAGIFEGEDNFLIGTPDVFKLRYIKARTQKDIKGLNKFKTCALNSISVDYTGEAGRFAAYEEDSQPVTTIITLQFTESTPIYDADYAEFLSDDDVGL